MIGANDTFATVLGSFNGIFNGIITLLISLIVFFIIWRVVTAWFIGGGDPKEVERGRQSVFVGLIVLVVVIGMWGIVALVRTTLFGT